MSQVITDFRAKHPQYDEVADDQLVPALHKKYYSSMPIEEFTQKIGYQAQALSTDEQAQMVAPQIPQQIEPVPTNKSMGELVTDKLSTAQQQPIQPEGPGFISNTAKGVAERAGDILGGLLTTINTTAVSAQESMPMGGLVWEGGVFPTYKNAEEFTAYKQAGGPDLLKEAETGSKGFDAGYIPTHTWEAVKNEFSENGPLSGSAWGEVTGYVAEQGFKSIPDMVGAVLNLPGYVMARSGEIGDERAKNKGKETTDLTDVLEAAPFALGSALLERIGAKGITEAGAEAFGKEALKRGYKEAAKRTAKAGGIAGAKEAGTEGIQEGIIEYAGEKFGTDAKMTIAESFDRGLGGAVAGGGMGTVAGTVSAGAKEATYSPEKELAKALSENIEGSEFVGIEEQAAASLSPDKAQLESTRETIKPEIPRPKEVMPELSASIDITDPEEAQQEEILPKEAPLSGKVEGLSVVEAPISEVKLSKDVPQFKDGAGKEGVVEPLGGTFERTGVAPIQIWVREDGTKEVISGRHRLDLAKRSGEETIPAQYHYESEGFNKAQAASLDAILNIREGQGKVKDYVEFIQANQFTEKEAAAEGILGRSIGNRAFTIATKGSEALIANHRADQVTDEGASKIANAAPNNEALQAVGIKAIQDGKTITVAENLVKAVASMTTDTQQASADLFGFDDSAMKEAVELAKKVSRKQAEIQRTLAAVTGAAKNPELAKKEGVDVKDPEGIRLKIKQLKSKKKAWDNWHTNPQLMKQLRDKPEAEVKTEAKPVAKKEAKPELELTQETEADIAKREKQAEEAKQAEAKEREAAEDKAQADKDAGDFVLAGSDLEADQAMARGQDSLFDSPLASKEDPVASSKAEPATKEAVKINYSNNAIEAFKQFRELRGEAKATKVDIQSSFDSLIKNKEAVLEQLGKLTKAQLLRYVGRNDLKKPQMVKSAYQTMVGAHVFGDATITIFGGSQTYEEQIADKVAKQTQEDINTDYERQRAARAEREKQKEAFIKSMTNPESLADFKEFIRVQGKAKLTAEQLKTYDTLVADSMLESEKQKPKTVEGVTGEIKTERAQAVHSKKGHDLFIVKLVDRVSKEQYKELNTKAKALGGYYSAYSKDGAIPGFQFKAIEEADQFEQLLKGKDIDKSDFAEAKADVKKASQADKLIEMADKLEAKANEDLGRDRQTNTGKRASEAANASERAYKQIAVAQTIRKIAIGLQQGEVVYLGKLTQRTQLEELQRIQRSAIPSDMLHSEYDGYSINRSIKEGITVEDYINKVVMPELFLHKETAEKLADKLADKLQGVRGYARLSADMRKLPMAEGKTHLVGLTKEQSTKLFAAQKAGLIGEFDLGFLPDRKATISRLEKLGITTDEQLRTAIRELDSLAVETQKEDPIKKLERDLIGKKIDGYFPTPKTLVEQMIDYADIKPGHEVLEPSAGKGNIADVIQQNEPDAIIEVVEINSGLKAMLEIKGYEVVSDDFMDYSGKQYDRIIMNPPFENFQDIDHVKHAYDLLKPGGKLVAIMGAGVKNSRKKAVEFREWVDSKGSFIEDLPEGSFKTSERQTGVATVMVTISKPDHTTEQRDTRIKGETFGMQVPKSKVITTAKFSTTIKKQFPTVKFMFTSGEGAIAVEKIVVPESAREKGVGTEAMKAIIDLAQKNDLIITLTPSADFVGNKARLNKFYKSLGFVDNKGKNKSYEISDTMYLEPKVGGTLNAEAAQAVVHAPGHNYVGLYRSMSLPPRQDTISIEGRTITMPKDPQRIEPIMRDLVKIMGRRIYNGKIKGKSAEGFYRPNVGELRTRRKNDVEVLAHEMAHYLDMYSNVTLPNFTALYKLPQFKDEVASLSYTDADQKIELIEGFAEFVRLWLTNSTEAQLRAPEFYTAFNKALARDKKLNKNMRSMQESMHKFYFQGADHLGRALIGREEGMYGKFMQWTYRRDSLIRQQTIDKMHAAREAEKELTGQVGNVDESAWKQFRIANGGSEGVAEYIMNYGTLKFADNGDLVVSGKGLYEILKPVDEIELDDKDSDQEPIDLLMRYFAGRRALELHRQKRENLIPKETAQAWSKLGRDYPVFESIFNEYKEFNTRMMDLYQASGMLTPDARQAMDKVNKDYVPFNRIRDAISEGNGVSAGFHRLKGGTANLEDILVNIQDGITSNVRAALNARAKQRLYQYIASHRDGAIWAVKVAPDSKIVKTHLSDMERKIGDVLAASGVVIEGELDLSDPDLVNFWQHGVKPKLTETGNFIDTVVVNGKPQYYEVQDPLLQEMLLGMNPESYSSFMNVMFGIKNLFTRSITLGVEFTGANLVRDTIGATFISKNNFTPFVDSFKGMYSFLRKDVHFQDFMRSGGGYSSRVHGGTADQARQRVRIKQYGVASNSQKILSVIDNFMSAFEYGTRIGEYRLAKKNNLSDMDAAFSAREISTDFSVYGQNHFFTGYIRTVPFLNAMIQSQDRVFREAFIFKKYGGNPKALAMKAFLGLTVPTLMLWLINKDDEDYKEIPDYEKRTNWHFPLGDGTFIKMPRPYDVGFVYATMPELYFKYIEDNDGREYAEGLAWTMLQMYGIDGVPAASQGMWDLLRNKKWTGAPVVPNAMADLSAAQQYNANTSETFIRLGQALNISPTKAEHFFKAHTGYLGGYITALTDRMMWDEEKFGEYPESQLADNIFIKRFITPNTRNNNRSMEKFFNIKEQSDNITADFKIGIDLRRAIKGDINGKFEDSAFFGLTGDEKAVLFALNDSMNDLIKVIYGKEGLKTKELSIRVDKDLTAEQKRAELDTLWNQRNKAFTMYYSQAKAELDKAKNQPIVKQAEEWRNKQTQKAGK